MDIKDYRDDRTRIYEITWYKEDFDMLFYEPYVAVSPFASDGARFYFYENPSLTSDSFRSHPNDSMGYFMEIGDISITSNEKLLEHIASLGRVPIELEPSSGGRPINVGYVKVKVQ